MYILKLLKNPLANDPMKTLFEQVGSTQVENF